jgi:hypothetical protein
VTPGRVTPRRLVATGAVVTVLGLAIAGTAPILGTGADERARTQQTTGGVAVLAGWALLGWGIHRLGRSGAK